MTCLFVCFVRRVPGVQFISVKWCSLSARTGFFRSVISWRLWEDFCCVTWRRLVKQTSSKLLKQQTELWLPSVNIYVGLICRLFRHWKIAAVLIGKCRKCLISWSRVYTWLDGLIQNFCVMKWYVQEEEQDFFFWEIFDSLVVNPCAST